MSWTINLMYLVLWTSVAGAFITIVWYLVGSLLERAGFLNITYVMLRMVAVFWLVPFVYMTLIVIKNMNHAWHGILLSPTPKLLLYATMFCSVWSVGALIGILNYVSQIIIISMRAHKSMECTERVQRIFERNCQALGMKNKRICVRQSYIEDVPKVIGIFHPTVFLPIQDYSEQELNIIFSHELTHVMHHDLLFKNLSMIVCAVHFFNPFAWYFKTLLGKWSEFACDYEVCVRECNIKEYYKVIIDMTEALEYIPVLSAHLVEGESELRERMEHVMKCYKKADRSKIVAAVLVVSMFVGSAVSVSVASVSSADAYVKYAQATDVATEEEYTENQLPEYTDLSEALSLTKQSKTKVLSGDVALLENGEGYSIDWDVKPSFQMRSRSFHAKKGQTITVYGMITPSGKSLRVGIIEPSAVKRYVTPTKGFTHDFEVKETGYYKIYAENKNDVTVNLSAHYEVN